MSLSKTANVLSNKQSDLVLNYLSTHSRNSLRDILIFLLSIKGGLRAKEISCITWDMVLDSDGNVSNSLDITNQVSKGKTGGRKIPLNKYLKSTLIEFHNKQSIKRNFDIKGNIISTQRSKTTSPQVIVNLFSSWYKDLNLIGCSSHSGRRTFITNCSRKISTVGGSLKDVQYLSGHSSLQTTQRYIELNQESKNKIVDLI